MWDLKIAEQTKAISKKDEQIQQKDEQIQQNDEQINMQADAIFEKEGLILQQGDTIIEQADTIIEMVDDMELFYASDKKAAISAREATVRDLIEEQQLDMDELMMMVIAAMVEVEVWKGERI